jgi:serine/threonine protein kinase
LADLIFSAKIPDDIAKAKLLRQVITGLLYLHKQKIYHCNLTPCNILINNGNVLVADFGLRALKKYQSLTTGYTTKSHYSSPEQLRERSATPKGSPESDVYAFGMITWESYHG